VTDHGRSGVDPVLAGRLLLLALAAAAVVVAVALTRRHDGATGGAAAALFVCPMHAEVKAAAPGDCPICRMALEPIAGRRPEAPAEDAEGPSSSSSGSTFSLPGHAGVVRYGVGLVRRHVLPQLLYAPAWIDQPGVITALFYKDELASLAPGETASFFQAGAPDVRVEARRLSEAPARWDGATALVRFQYPPARAPWRPGSPGWLQLRHQAREMLTVPTAAILASPDGPYVLAYVPARRAFSRRPVEIGKAFHGVTAVVSGLREREVVVTQNAFFLEAERRLHAGADPLAEVRP
jgi:hypothetical protein